MWIKSPGLRLFVLRIKKDENIEGKIESVVLKGKLRGIQKASCHVHVYKNHKKENRKLEAERWDGRTEPEKKHRQVWEQTLIPSLFPC